MKFGVAVAFTVSAIVVVAVRLPEVPVIVTVDVPVVAVLLAVNVNTLVPVVGFVPNAAVTPLGRPDAASVTLPVNPPDIGHRDGAGAAAALSDRTGCSANPKA